MNFHTISIEAAIGSNFADTFLPSHPGAIFAGGGGADGFEFPTTGGGPTIVWGGAGADSYKFEPSNVNPADILVAAFDTLTEDNFHLFSLEDSNLGSDFNFFETETATDVARAERWLEDPRGPITFSISWQVP